MSFEFYVVIGVLGEGCFWFEKREEEEEEKTEELEAEGMRRIKAGERGGGKNNNKKVEG